MHRFTFMPAVEALRKSSADLSAAERKQVEDALALLLAGIDRGEMRHQGMTAVLAITNMNVCAAMTVVFDEHQWVAQWTPVYENEAAVYGSERKHVKTFLSLTPKLEAYRAAREMQH